MLFGEKTHLFGLDIGSNSLKLEEIRKTGKGYQLRNAGIMHLPPEAIVEGAIMNAPAVVDAIQNLLDVHKPETRNVATSVCGHSVIIKKVSLPVMSREELEQSIQWEAEQYIPFNIHDVNLDYQILSPAPGHTWPRADGSRLRVGLDDLAQRLFPWTVAVELPARGQKVKEGEPVARISAGGQEALVAAPVSGTIEAVNAAVARDPALVKSDFAKAGFVFDGESRVLANPDDDHMKLVFDEAVRGRTDRFLFRFRKPAP